MKDTQLYFLSEFQIVKNMKYKKLKSKNVMSGFIKNILNMYD